MYGLRYNAKLGADEEKITDEGQCGDICWNPRSESVLLLDCDKETKDFVALVIA